MKPSALESPSGWTLETWIKPAEQVAPSPVLIDYASPTGPYRLRLETERAGVRLNGAGDTLSVDLANLGPGLDATGFTFETWIKIEAGDAVVRFGNPEFRLYVSHRATRSRTRLWRTRALLITRAAVKTGTATSNSRHRHMALASRTCQVRGPILRLPCRRLAPPPPTAVEATRSSAPRVCMSTVTSRRLSTAINRSDLNDVVMRTATNWRIAFGEPLETWSSTPFAWNPWDATGQAYAGGVAETRVWRGQRSADQIRDNMLALLSDHQSDLIALYPFSEGQGQIIAARMPGPPALPPLRLNQSDAGDRWVNVPRAIVASAHASEIRAPAFVREHQWNHVAAAYSPSYGVKLGGGDSLDCGLAASLNLTDAMTLEAWVACDDDGALVGPIVSQWDSALSKSSYALRIDASGQAVFQVAIGHDMLLSVTGGHVSRTGWSHVAATYTATLAQDGGAPRMDAQGQPLVECIATVYVDGVGVRSAPTLVSNNGAVKPPNTNLRIGGGAGQDPPSYTGRLDDVRIWNRALDAGQVAAIHRDPRTIGDQRGLVGYWSFDEGGGSVARDTAGSNNATLSDGVKWESSSVTAQWQVFLNGVAVTGTISQVGLAAAPEPMLVLGGACSTRPDDIQSSSPVAETPFTGQLDEIRIWNTARTQQQVNDALYRPLEGNETGLMAYWPIEAATDANAVVCDRGSRSLDAFKGSAQVVSSDAPLGEEGPEVANALASLPRQGATVTGALAIVEYGELETSARRVLSGTMKRCYAFIDNGTLNLVTSFAVGELDVQFVGQVQTEPTLVGYIEGAPPVPSENLTAPDGSAQDGYKGASSIALTEMDNTVLAFAANRSNYFDTSLDLKAGAVAGAAVAVGGVVSQQLFRQDSRIMVHARLDTSQGWLQDASLSAGTLHTLSNTLELRGRWEDRNAPAYADLGARWTPDNGGYALVKSRTADLYALQLKATRAIVSYQVVPNPDIPEDWNIITFPIDPRYVKNGSLDGWVGVHSDDDPHTDSYFKPREAYQLKAQIEREEAAVRSLYDQYDVARARSNVSPSDVLPRRDSLDAARRSLVNTYVWTAGGGLYAEEEQTASTQEQSEGGSYYFLGQGGMYLSLTVAGSGWGLGLEADVLVGVHLDVSVTKSAQSSRSFGLNVQLDVESNVADATGKPVPGKVDAYRFMSFYLAPASAHAEFFYATVVDQKWLATANDPNAIALRMARGKPNNVWRVLHRVTYVHRIPSDVDQPSIASEPPKALPAHVDGTGNRALIALIDARLGQAPQSLAEVAAVLDTVFAAARDDDVGAPWLAFTAKARSAGTEQAQLTRIRQNALTYLSAYYGVE